MSEVITKPELMVPLNSSDKNCSVNFFIPGLGGSCFIFRNLAQKLTNISYGLQLYGFNPGEIPFKKIEELAEYNISLISKINLKNKKINIIGYSYGGTIAFEMIRLLENLNINCNLVLVDSIPFQKINIEKNFTQYSLDIIEYFINVFSIKLSNDINELQILNAKNLKEYILLIFKEGGISLSEEMIEHLLELCNKQLVADFIFENKKVEKITLLLAKEKSSKELFQYNKQNILWTSHSKKVNIVQIDGNHYTVFDNRYNDNLSIKISEVLI